MKLFCTGVTPRHADSAVDHVLNPWMISLGQSDVSHPVGQLAAKQREWDKPHVDADLARLMAAYLTDITTLAYLQYRPLPTAATGYMRCPLHLAVFVWTTRPSELPSVYASVPNFASPTSVHAAPTSTPKARTISLADAVPAI
jgi:hypothetical protein